MREKKDSALTKIIAILVYIFLAMPILVVILSSFSPTSYLKFPPEEFSLKWYRNIFESHGFVEAFFVSVTISAIATVVDIILGVTASIAITKYKFPGRTLLTNFLTSPMFMPGITFGFVLMQIFGQFSGVPYFTRILLGHIVIILPYIIRNVTSVMIGYDWTLEEAALSLGASPVKAFYKVTLPLVKPGVMAGSLLAFLYSFDDATISTFLTGPGFTTLPVRMMTYMEFAFDPTLAAISTLLIVCSLIAILLMEKLVGLDMFLK